MATYTNFNQVKRGGGGVSPAPALCTRLRGVAYERPDERGRLRRRAAGGGGRNDRKQHYDRPSGTGKNRLCLRDKCGFNKLKEMDGRDTSAASRFCRRLLRNTILLAFSVPPYQRDGAYLLLPRPRLTEASA